MSSSSSSSSISSLFSLLWSPFNFIAKTLGFYNKKGKVLFLGLDNAGKSTLLCMMKYGKLMAVEPTARANHEEFKVGGVQFSAYDLGGHAGARHLWSNFMFDVDAIVYLMDAADRDRFVENDAEIHKLLNDEKIKNVPVLILGNKIDSPRAVSRQQLIDHLNIEDVVSGVDGRDRVNLVMCSIARKTGYEQGFKWLATKF